MMRLGILVAALAVFAALPAAAADASLSAAANEAFLAANAKKPGVVVELSGLQHRIIQSGYGKRPTQYDLVTVDYKGSLINGTVFDSTEPGLPATFTVSKLISGWTEALELMREGDHWELVISPNLAYGTRGAGDGAIPPGQALVFDLQLEKVAPPPKSPDQDQNGSGGSGQ